MAAVIEGEVARTVMMTGNVQREKKTRNYQKKSLFPVSFLDTMSKPAAPHGAESWTIRHSS